MHEMSIAEAVICLENIQYTDITFKNIMRYNIWTMYNSNPWIKNKNIKITDIMELPWDDRSDTMLDENERKKVKEYQKNMEEMLKTVKIVEEKYMG